MLLTHLTKPKVTWDNKFMIPIVGFAMIVCLAGCGMKHHKTSRRRTDETEQVWLGDDFEIETVEGEELEKLMKITNKTRFECMTYSRSQALMIIHQYSMP